MHTSVAMETSLHLGSESLEHTGESPEPLRLLYPRLLLLWVPRKIKMIWNILSPRAKHTSDFERCPCLGRAVSLVCAALSVWPGLSISET